MHSTDWQSLDEFWYRKTELFPMKWSEDIDILNNCIIRPAPYGGAIATIRNEKAYQPAKGSIKDELRIYTAAGSLVGSLQWPYRGLVTMGWANDDVIACVFKDGVIRTFSSTSEKLHFFRMDERIKDEGGIIQGLVYNQGLVVITAHFGIYVNVSCSRKVCYKLPCAVLKSPPLALCVLPENINSSSMLNQDVTILLSDEDGSLYRLDRKQCIKLNSDSGPFISLSASLSGRLLACLTSNGTLIVYKTDDFTRVIDVASSRLKRFARWVWRGYGVRILVVVL